MLVCFQWIVSLNEMDSSPKYIYYCRKLVKKKYRLWKQKLPLQIFKSQDRD